MEAHETHEAPILTLRAPAALIDRANRLVPRMAADAARTERTTRSTVIRAALVEGLRVLERRYK